MGTFTPINKKRDPRRRRTWAKDVGEHKIKSKSLASRRERAGKHHKKACKVENVVGVDEWWKVDIGDGVRMAWDAWEVRDGAGTEWIPDEVVDHEMAVDVCGDVAASGDAQKSKINTVFDFEAVGPEYAPSYFDNDLQTCLESYY